MIIRKQQKNLLIISVMCLMPCLAHAVNTFGYVEKVRINPGNTTLKAKLDTGAVSASLNAINIKIINKGTQKWVHFDVPQSEGVMHLERKLVKFVGIKKRYSEKKGALKHPLTLRPVVKMQLTLGCETKNIDVNLANRQTFNYPLLLGRKALIMFKVAVNPSKTFVSTLKEHGC